MSDWKDMLIINWSDTEKNIVKQYIQKVEEKKIKLDKVLIQQLNLYVTVFQILLQQWNLKQQRNEKKLNLNININSLDEFYRECDNIEGGNPAEINNIENSDDPCFQRIIYSRNT